MGQQAYFVGNGNIAKAIGDCIERDGAIYFCSGVSNSRLTEDMHFQREIDLLYEVRRWAGNECLFYFSSIGVNFSPNTPYFKHKLRMEELVKQLFGCFVILRIGNLIGDTNPNTFINYIKDRQAKGLSVEIKDEYRYMIDGATLNILCQTLPLDQKIELTVATKVAKVRDLI